MNLHNRMIVLAVRPDSEASADNFRLVQADVPPLAEHQVLVRHHYLSLDPYMRGRMNDTRSYAPPQPLGEVMIGGTVGEVVQSRSDAFQPGDKVVGMGGWQLYSVVDGRQRGVLRKVDAASLPLSTFLGVVGMPGVTAWVGLNKFIGPKAGDTIVVSAASGSVGATVGQLAKAQGCRVVGIAGGPLKCRHVRDELGFDECIDYKDHPGVRSLASALKLACPDGVDGCFENVGGTILDAVMLRSNPFARIAVCGMIAGYNGQAIPITVPTLILTNRLRIEGFIVTEHLDLWPKALQELSAMVRESRIVYRETIAQSLESAPSAFIGLLRGRHMGKQLVKLIDESAPG